jgi:ribonuclease HI
MSDEGKREELMKRLRASLDDGADTNIPLGERQQRALIDLKVSTSTKQKEDNKKVLAEAPLLDEVHLFDEDTNEVVGHSFIEEGEVEESPIDDAKCTIDRDLTYIIRVNSAHSGPTRVVEGSGIGFTLLQVDGNTGQQSVIQTNQVLLPGPRTPFEADYSALVMAMRHAKNIGIRHLIMVSNDLGIVRQVNGEGGIRDNGYQRELHQKVKDLEASFDSFAIRHRSDTTPPEDHTHEPAHLEVNNNILAKTALARQRNLESEWRDMVDPITDKPAASNTNLNRYNIQPDKEYLLQFDGGARGNPSGIAGAGMVIFDDRQDEIWCGWNYLGNKKTNNIAEYESLIAGLECAQKLGIRKLRAEGDSELVVKQVNGLYRCKKDWLRPLHARVKQLMSKFDSCSVKSIPRADNKRADFLANHAMDTGTCNSADL